MRIKKLTIVALTVLLLAGCVGGSRIDSVPMYGQPKIERTPVQKSADEEFIEKASRKFGSREKASEVWNNEGEKYLNQRDFDYAMRRYNQAWLLDPKNYQPYWGFGRVLLEQKKTDEAIAQLETSEALCKDAYQKVAILSDIGSAYTVKGATNPKYFQEANKKFTESTVLDPTYPNSWRRWAFSLYEQGNYKGAQEKVKIAQGLNARPFPPAFIAELERKLQGSVQ